MSANQFWNSRWRKLSSVIALRSSLLAIAAVAGLVVLGPVHAHAQWWRSTPVDFESCADAAEKAKSKEEKTSALAECNAKFAGRRKPGGGYTYYDFMQDRTFDIAGPNPTPEEQKQYRPAIYRLSREPAPQHHRRGLHGQATTQQQQESQRGVQQVALRTEVEKIPVPVASPVKQAARIKASNCAKNAFSCEWPRLSQSIDDLKKLFGATPSNPTPSKPKRG